ncbi:MAG: hypothetical protein KDD64_00265 [Bdellovibrionales bacterium]|nr:hypothetical protein [Bdellovibrionales bacterium]
MWGKGQAGGALFEYSIGVFLLIGVAVISLEGVGHASQRSLEDASYALLLGGSPQPLLNPSSCSSGSHGGPTSSVCPKDDQMLGGGQVSTMDSKDTEKPDPTSGAGSSQQDPYVPSPLSG